MSVAVSIIEKEVKLNEKKDFFALVATDFGSSSFLCMGRRRHSAILQSNS